MSGTIVQMEARAIAAAVAGGQLDARAVVEAHLGRIEANNAHLNAFTQITAERALAQADAIDERRNRGEAVGSLAGVPFGVKNLFDIAGVATLAGSKINAANAPAEADAFLVRQLISRDAILLGAQNMGEYAYDFTGENQHYGPSRNPHDAGHMSGGSSGGSGTAVAAGMVALSLGSDTNGSIRVPSSFCGLFGLKPTYGRLSRGGTFPFVASIDHLGPLARSPADLALAFDALQGDDDHDGAQAAVGPLATFDGLSGNIGGLRIARASGYFARGGEPIAFEAVDVVADALGAFRSVEIPEAERARAAGALVSLSFGGCVLLERLRTRVDDFDLDVRDRLLAGALLPATWINKAHKFRRWYHDAVVQLFQDVDIILAPSTPLPAPRIGQKTMVLDGVEMLVRANIGIYTQPISFAGLPVVSVPVWLAGRGLPIGVQVIAAPWREDLALNVAEYLWTQGICRAPVAQL